MSGIDNNTALYLRGDSFSDLSLNSHSITNNGATISNSGKLGKAYSVKNSKFTVSSLNLGQYFTIESYVYLDSSISSHKTRALLNTSNGATDSNGNLLLWFDYTGSKHSIELHIGDHINWSTNVIHAISPSFDKWIHIAITRSGSKFTLFIDGINVGTTSYNMSNFTHVIFGDIFNATERRYLNGKIENIMISDNVKYTQNFTPPTNHYDSIDINITNQTKDKIDFTVSKLGKETINKIEVLVNGIVYKTYDTIGDLTYDIDKSLCVVGINKIKIRVTFDNSYTEEKETTYFLPLDELPTDNLSTTATLREVFDRQQQLLFNIGQQKDALKSILLSKNVEVAEDEDKMSILIQKVNEFDNLVPKKLWLYKDGDECASITGGWNRGNILDSGVTNGGSVVKKSDSLYIQGSSVLGCGAVNQIDFSKYSKLYIELGASGSGNISVLISDSAFKELGTTARLVMTDEFSKTIKELDISTVNKSQYLTLSAYNKQSNIYKIWLEK